MQAEAATVEAGGLDAQGLGACVGGHDLGLRQDVQRVVLRVQHMESQFQKAEKKEDSTHAAGFKIEGWQRERRA